MKVEALVASAAGEALGRVMVEADVLLGKPFGSSARSGLPFRRSLGGRTLLDDRRDPLKSLGRHALAEFDVQLVFDGVPEGIQEVGDGARACLLDVQPDDNLKPTLVLEGVQDLI